MKKIFTFLAGVLISIGMQAVDQIAMGQFGSWDPVNMQVAEGNVITYDANSSWVGGDVWLGHNLSAYEYVCIVLEDCQGEFKFTLEYDKIAGDENNVSQEYQFSTGTKQVTFKLDPARKQKVNKIMLQNTSPGGTLDVGNLYAGSAAEFETALDLGTFSGWSDNNYNTTTHVLSMTREWDGGQWWLGEADYSEYVNFVVEFDEATCDGCVAVEYNNGITKTESHYSASATSVSVPIREEGASSVQKITIKGKTDAATITLGTAYLVRDIQTLLPQYVTKDLDLSAMNEEGWSSEYNADAKTITFTGEWGARGWLLNKDLSAYTKVIVEFAVATPCGGVLKAEYAEEQYNEQGFETGAQRVELVLHETHKSQVVGIFFSTPEVANLVIKSAYLVKSTSTDVENILPLPTDGVYYNILGQKVAYPTRGNIYIQNGKKVIFL